MPQKFGMEAPESKQLYIDLLMGVPLSCEKLSVQLGHLQGTKSKFI